jgi:hypothetical protein
VVAAVFGLDGRLEGACFGGALGVVLVIVDGVDDSDWAAVDDNKPSENRKKIPAKATTAKRRTQTLPTAESWHP